jgi:hypothetical protein
MSTVADLVVASASVKGGRLFIQHRREFDRQIAQMKDGWQLELTVQRRRATRSVQQNAWYWSGVLGALREHTGHTEDELHDLCKAMFLPKRLALNNGNGEVVGEYVLGGSTRQLNTNEFTEYIERIRQWAAETLDCDIPDPDGAGGHL